MRYIKTIILKNFQSYKDETIQLGPGLNLLLGTSDSGKSAILRAISFVLYNYPKNNSLIHWGQTETTVTLVFSDGVKVTRIKSDIRNAIIAYDANGKKIEKEKIDTDIPEEIKALLGDPPEDELNGLISYADQFAKMFLVDLSPTDLPRSLSNLTGIEILEESAKQLMQNYKSLEKKTKSDEKEYKSLLEESQSYGYIDHYETKLKAISIKINQITLIEQKVDDLSNLIKDIDLVSDPNIGITYDNIIKRCNDLLDRVKSIEKMSYRLQKLEIFSLLCDDNTNENHLDIIKKCMTKINKSIENFDDYNDNIKKINKLEKIQNDYLETKSIAQNIAKEYEILKESYKSEEKNLEKFKQFLIDEKIQCETCGSILS
jgi:DNA repair exonuclease SbcCD ATPase subunit